MKWCTYCLNVCFPNDDDDSNCCGAPATTDRPTDAQQDKLYADEQEARLIALRYMN